MNKKIHLVHSEEYENWVFDKTHPTQGRRFTNARNLLRAASEGREFELIEVEPRLATRQDGLSQFTKKDRFTPGLGLASATRKNVEGALVQIDQIWVLLLLEGVSMAHSPGPENGLRQQALLIYLHNLIKPEKATSRPSTTARDTRIWMRQC